MPPTASGFTNQDPYVPDRLFAGDFPRADDKITVASSAALTRGALLGQITASGKFVLSDPGAADGSEVPRAILAEDADASAADAEALAYFTGQFNENVMTFGGAHTADTVRTALREKGIFLHKAQPA